ncbi:hypothetical protein [Agromyces sp. ZXT2-3]|uniref:hypothetical protein n=1 Tax=Agromyces sp. ZXT2-3 TaxID=3461152 RepID=UPI0040552E1F
MIPFDRAASSMDDLAVEIRQAVDDDVNEADTRLRIINHLLTDVLGWQDREVRAEEHTESGFIDYHVGQGGAHFVLEAKRVGLSFELPAGTGAAVLSLPGLTRGTIGRPLRTALEQAARYAQERGIPVAVAFNGKQLVAFMASRSDGIPPLEGKALVFGSPDAMVDEFLLLWNALSPEGVHDRRLQQLLKAGASLPPEPLSFRLTNYPGSQRRNDLQTGLQILGDLFLGDLEELPELQDEFLRECYATSGALSQYAEVSRQILATRYEILTEVGTASVAPINTRRGMTKGFSADILQAALSNRPIILLGDVGAGKSTFIERLIHVDAQEILGESICIYVDFGSSSALSSLSDHVLQSCIDQLESKYGTDVLAMSFVEDALRTHLKRFENSPAGRLRDVDPAAYTAEKVAFIQEIVRDRSTYLKAAFEWITRSWHRQVVIFLDNVDQRDASDQNGLFLIANELAQRWPATVFVTLRPETFYNSEREGAISGYHPRVFTISPPRTDVMLRLRVNFALDQLRESGRIGNFPGGVQVDSESLEIFLEMLADNLKSNDPLARLLDNLAGGNMRLALQFVTDFIGSGHIATQKIIDVQRERGYTIPAHEFLRSIMFGDHRYYDPDSSPVPNLFRLTTRDGREHFLAPLLLAFVQKAGDVDTEHGYISSSSVYDGLQELGFDPAQISEAIEFALRYRLIDATRRYGRSTSDELLRISTVGAYCYKSLIQMFTYIDATSVDIPILDDEVRPLVTDAYTLAERVDRAELIRQYLNVQWSLVPANEIWDWLVASGELAVDIERVRRRLPVTGDLPNGSGAYRVRQAARPERPARGHIG